MLCEQQRYQARDHSGQAGPGTRNTYKDMTEPGTGQQMTFIESPDMTEVMAFNTKTLEHVKVPSVPEGRRNMSDMEKEQEMRKKFGRYGPGERMTKSIQQLKKEELDKQQDIDGLPWEVRWRKSLVPTQEEIVQDLKDKYDMWIQDPIEREQQWYLHWKDRMMKVERDRMIWPQGYTDYLDHYDENGRRRTLPGDQRWSNTSWKHLADTKYRDRMWMVEGEERKAIQRSMQDEETILFETEKTFTEQADVWQGLNQGVIDLDPDQAYQALSGTADPLEVAKTKGRLNEYAAHQMLKLKSGEKQEVDPVTGFPKSDKPPLKSGLTIEQAAAIDSRVGTINTQMEEHVAIQSDSGTNPWVQIGSEHLKFSEKMKVHPDDKPQPGLRQLTEMARDKVIRASENYKREIEGKSSESAQQLESADVDESESPITGKINKFASGLRDIEEDIKKSQKSGFIDVPTRREGDPNPKVEQIALVNPELEKLEDMPEWYRQSLVEPGPMIEKYGVVRDPIEMRDADIKYRMKSPEADPEDDLVVHDLITQGDNVFDEGKLYKQRTTPEYATGLTKPLPLFKDAKDKKLQDAEAAKKLSKSERVRLERQARAKKLMYDPDLALPDLPWETDSVVDPYRGIIEGNEIEFDKKAVEKVYTRYKEFLTQKMAEFANVSQQTTEDRCEQLLRDAIQTVRRGEVGDRPEIDERLEDVFKVSFEAHFKQFLSDWLRFHSGRKPEADAVKGESDDLMRKATAKTKQCGKAFTSFMQEMTALELDKIKKNPIQRHTIMVRDKKHEVLAKPFIRWISSELSPFIKSEFTAFEVLEQNRDMLNRHLTEARIKAPMRVEGVQDKTRDVVVEAFYTWCRGALLFYSSRHLFDMFLRYAESRFRQRSEDFAEESYECFQTFFKASKDCAVYIPVPHSDPMYDFQDSDFLEGENGYHAELLGDFDKAERIWNTGTSIRWYPMQDETDLIHFYERRGRVSQAFDCSDRCLDALNKKSHPSVHPFPDRAKKYLEGAPLSQETAEHLWLRYMGDVYAEHADFHNRCGKVQTGRDYLDQSLNFYHIALRTAEERLPKTWSAPLLTKAKLLCRSLLNDTDGVKYSMEVEQCVEEIYKLGKDKTEHWMERFTDMHYRVALLIWGAPAFVQRCYIQASKKAKMEVDSALITKSLQQRAKQHTSPPEVEVLEDAMDIYAEDWRRMIIRFRDQEREGTDEWQMLTHLYFLIRVRPRNADEVDRYKDMYWKTYDYFYTQTALNVRSRSRLFHDVVRRLCQILIPGTTEHKKLLMGELEKINDKLRHATNGDELDRTINALELHLKDPKKPAYIYGSESLHRRNMQLVGKMENPLLSAQGGRSVYEKLRAEEKAIKHNIPLQNPKKQTGEQSPGQQTTIGGSDADLSAPPPPSGRELLARELYGTSTD